jgi:hypothetical protein
MVKTCPCTTISKPGIIPTKGTKLPSTIRSQNVHGSDLVMPSCQQIAKLITFTPDPPSIKIF